MRCVGTLFLTTNDFAGRQDYVTVKNMKVPFNIDDFHIHGGIIDRGYVLGTVAFKRHVCAPRPANGANFEN